MFSLLCQTKTILQRYPKLYAVTSKTHHNLANKLKIFQRNIYSKRNKMVSLKSSNGFQGNILLAYHNTPFLLSKGEGLPNSHSSYWEARQIANIFLDLGYNVDVIDRLNEGFVPQKRYDIFVGH